METLQNVQKIQIEIDGNPPFEYIVVKQGESGSRVAEIILLENKKEFSIPSGTTAKIKFYKPDGKPVLNPAEISGNVIKVAYTEQMLAASGTGRGEIALYNGNNVLRTATYYTKNCPDGIRGKWTNKRQRVFGFIRKHYKSKPGDRQSNKRNCKRRKRNNGSKQCSHSSNRSEKTPQQ